MYTTPHARIDVAAVIPQLAPLARTTIRLHPRPGTPTAGQSSMGGPLLWPADEPWPTCDGPQGDDHLDSWPGEPEVPLVPVLQLYAADVPQLPFPAGTDLLQVLWCPFDHAPWGSPRPQLRWRRRADITDPRRLMPSPDTEADQNHIPDPCVLSPEPVTEYPTHDLSLAVWSQIRDQVAQIKQDTGWDYDSDLAVAPGTKVDGYPGWTQQPDWPECACGSQMQHLLTVASWEFNRGDDKRWITMADRPAMAGWAWDSPEDHPWRAIRNPAGLMLGDVGGICLFVCTTCPDRPFDYRFDCS
ncbi:DUF1963 domain-containing protein [Catellatospora citrea]|uniref:DUF1963 domain-containing protein n=1 Tax=Catellatospora citrea TaxID=53366 RepID=A0A8J3P2E3_9ACTN|nr:DUF1963 domain-containing protein [Catellatospora citrea]RKE10738.1 hypothetical protein C8E86_5655 [Catellatospora citrea]GIG01128.1 hypothetical protein Cci01nite_62210 [Catellatospora citrea]